MRCPLCDEVLEADAAVREHLAVAHELRDDPGTESLVEDLGVLPPLAVAPEPAADVEAEVEQLAAPSTDSHVYDAAADDARFRSVTIVVGTVIVLLFATLALVLGR